MRTLILLLSLFTAGKAAASGEINVLTDLLSPFPPGCVAISLPTEPASEDNLLWNEVVPAPGIGSASADAEVRVTIWRVGCHDEGFSVVMVRLQKLSGPRPVLVPQVFVEAGEVALPFHEGQLITLPAVGNIGAAGNVLTEAGQTFMLAVDPVSIDEATRFLPEDYNGRFTLELFWGGFAPGAAPVGELFPIFAYEPALDPPQFDTPLLHGRMTGAYVFDDKPSAGLFLNVGENITGNDDNFLFAAFFSYLDGAPFWTVGSPGPQDPGIGSVSFPMFAYSGGDLFTNPASYRQEDLAEVAVGSLGITAIDCNTLRLDYDFNGIGAGSGTLLARRLIRIAGYDCNPWR